MRKRKRMRRIFAAILALWLLSAPALSAESQPSPLVITIAGPYADSLSSAYEDPLREFLEEKFAISFVPLQIDDANASYAYRLRAAANEFPDIMLYDAQWDFLYFIQANSLRALPDVMSDYPHLRPVYHLSLRQEFAIRRPNLGHSPQPVRGRAAVARLLRAGI